MTGFRLKDFMKTVKALKGTSVPMTDLAAVMEPTPSTKGYGANTAGTSWAIARDYKDTDPIGNLFPPSQMVVEECQAPKQKSKKMCYDCDECECATLTGEDKQRKDLLVRISQVQDKHWTQLRKDFYIDNDDRPYTAKELTDRIQAGKFILKDETKNQHTYHCADYIVWRDPAHPADEDGFQTAMNKLSDAEIEAQDVAKFQPIEAGFKALKDFQSATFH